MKSLIAIPLVLAAVTADPDISTRLQNLRALKPEPRVIEWSPETVRSRWRDLLRDGSKCGYFSKCHSCAESEDCYYNLRVGRCVNGKTRDPDDKFAMTPGDDKFAMTPGECPDELPMYDLEAGATCAEGYEPLTSSWEDCAAAAKSLGFEDEAVAYAKYNKHWGTTRPEGCFRKGNGEFHFNDGAGGDFKGNDRILCVLKGQGPTLRKAAGSSLVDTVKGTLGKSIPEGRTPRPIFPRNREDNGGIIGRKLRVPGNLTEPTGETYRFYSEFDGWMKHAPETVCGGDERERIRDTTSDPWRWIVDLEMQTKSGNTYICSGFFISKRAVMTAGHCVYIHDEGGFVESVRVSPGRNGRSFPFGRQFASDMFTTQRWRRRRLSEFDYATVVLPDDTFADQGVGHFGFTSDLSNVDAVNVAGYPGDKDRGTTLWWSHDSVTATSRRLSYMADTAGGMSGGPVWAAFDTGSDIERRIVGIHTNGGCPNRAVRVNDEVFEWMMDFRDQHN